MSLFENGIEQWINNSCSIIDLLRYVDIERYMGLRDVNTLCMFSLTVIVKRFSFYNTVLRIINACLLYTSDAADE